MTQLSFIHRFERVQNEIHQRLDQECFVADHGRKRSRHIEADSDPVGCSVGPDDAIDVMQNLLKIDPSHIG